MTEDEIDDIAYGIVLDYLDDGPEFLDVVNAVDDNYDDQTDEDYTKVADAVRKRLKGLF